MTKCLQPPSPHACEELKRPISGDRATLTRGATNKQAQAQLAPLADARVLVLADAEGVFGGWESEPQQARLFQTMMDYFILGGSWCCTSRDKDDGRAYYKRPPGLRMPR